MKVKVCVGNSSVVTIYIITYKTQTGTSCEKRNSKAFRLGIEPTSSGLLDQCSTTELQKPLPTTWARVQYIYINEMLMPVKYKGILGADYMEKFQPGLRFQEIRVS